MFKNTKSKPLRKERERERKVSKLSVREVKIDTERSE